MSNLNSKRSFQVSQLAKLQKIIDGFLPENLNLLVLQKHLLTLSVIRQEHQIIINALEDQPNADFSEIAENEFQFGFASSKLYVTLQNHLKNINTESTSFFQSNEDPTEQKDEKIIRLPVSTTFQLSNPSQLAATNDVNKTLTLKFHQHRKNIQDCVLQLHFDRTQPCSKGHPLGKLLRRENPLDFINTVQVFRSFLKDQEKPFDPGKQIIALIVT